MLPAVLWEALWAGQRLLPTSRCLQVHQHPSQQLQHFSKLPVLRCHTEVREKILRRLPVTELATAGPHRSAFHQHPLAPRPLWRRRWAWLDTGLPVKFPRPTEGLPRTEGGPLSRGCRGASRIRRTATPVCRTPPSSGTPGGGQGGQMPQALSCQHLPPPPNLAPWGCPVRVCLFCLGAVGKD